MFKKIFIDTKLFGDRITPHVAPCNIFLKRSAYSRGAMREPSGRGTGALKMREWKMQEWKKQE